MSALPEDVRLPLLEKRTYLHGTTLFEALSARTPGPGALSFSISRRIESDNVRLYRRQADAAVPSHEYARLKWASGGEQLVIGVEPLRASDCVERKSYNEDLVVSRVEVAGQTVALNEASTLGLAATLVPMFKVLLRPLAPPSKGMWMFTRLDLRRSDISFPPLRLTLGHMVGGKLARCSIDTSGEHLGELYFSWVPEKAAL